MSESRLFEAKVRKTIRRFGLFCRDDRLVVACSGGKDSTVVLSILGKFGYDVEALAVDEGIKGYRDSTLEDISDFCKDSGVPLRVVSFKEEFGLSLDRIARKKGIRPCAACGVLRRYLINKFARGYDAAVTGHNLDDEAQSIIMNIMKSNVHLLPRLGPKTGHVFDSKFTNRVKPLYLCPEKEVAAYAFRKKLKIRFTECPYSGSSYRAAVRDFLNGLEAEHPGTKLGIISSFLKLMPALRKLPISKQLNYCSCCGEPAGRSVCSACCIVLENVHGYCKARKQ
ncbi:TIGR00269 family protein [Candidatus Woesearchaeota archaeon]|nr:TIGR00269 family protein [Candidatus Woesearchaeota archaeon]